MKILELELQTNNLKLTEKFYSEVLELEINDKNPNSVAFIVGQSILRFTEHNDKSRKYHFAFNIPNNKLEDAIKWISTRSELIKNSEDSIITRFDNWNAESIYFYDNNKNILEFISRYDLENPSNKFFDSKLIQSISEIGVVTDKPLVLAEKLIKEENLDYFKKGPKREDFTALGDDNGLIVISNPNRNWYPTNNRAEKHWAKMKILAHETIRQIDIIQ